MSIPDTITTGTLGSFNDCQVDSADMSYVLGHLSEAYTMSKDAVIRELAVNALDAQATAGTVEPITITLPTPARSSLIVEDRGTGMSYDDMLRVLTRYGASTKRDKSAPSANKVIGKLGIGIKSPFAVTDQYTITSVFDKREITMLMLRGPMDMPQWTIVSDVPTDAPNGLTVEVPTKPEDRWEWIAAANRILTWFDPESYHLNGAEKPKPWNAQNTKGISGGDLLFNYVPNAAAAVVKMGPIAYAIPDHISKKVKLEPGDVILAEPEDFKISRSRESIDDNHLAVEKLSSIYNEAVDTLLGPLLTKLRGYDNIAELKLNYLNTPANMRNRFILIHREFTKTATQLLNETPTLPVAISYYGWNQRIAQISFEPRVDDSGENKYPCHLTACMDAGLADKVHTHSDSINHFVDSMTDRHAKTLNITCINSRVSDMSASELRTARAWVRHTQTTLAIIDNLDEIHKWIPAKYIEVVDIEELKAALPKRVSTKRVRTEPMLQVARRVTNVTRATPEVRRTEHTIDATKDLLTTQNLKLVIASPEDLRETFFPWVGDSAEYLVVLRVGRKDENIAKMLDSEYMSVAEANVHYRDSIIRKMTKAQRKVLAEQLTQIQRGSDLSTIWLNFEGVALKYGLTKHPSYGLLRKAFKPYSKIWFGAARRASSSQRDYAQFTKFYAESELLPEPTFVNTNMSLLALMAATYGTRSHYNESNESTALAILKTAPLIMEVDA